MMVKLFSKFVVSQFEIQKGLNSFDMKNMNNHCGNEIEKQ
jgi:hypothetical protein